MEMIAITGNTYLVKDALKSLGARWDAEKKAWLIAADKAEAAKKVVAGGSATPTKVYRPTTCIVCGCKAGRPNSRGYVEGPKIYRSGECSDCYEERKMGY